MLQSVVPSFCSDLIIELIIRSHEQFVCVQLCPTHSGQVLFSGDVTEALKISGGVKQCLVLAPALFSIFFMCMKSHVKVWYERLCECVNLWMDLNLFKALTLSRKAPLNFISCKTYLEDESTHPQAGREDEQGVRKEDEVAFI